MQEAYDHLQGLAEVTKTNRFTEIIISERPAEPSQEGRTSHELRSGMTIGGSSHGRGQHIETWWRRFEVDL